MVYGVRFRVQGLGVDPCKFRVEGWERILVIILRMMVNNNDKYKYV